MVSPAIKNHSYFFTDDEQLIAADWKRYKNYTVRPVKSTEIYYRNLIELYSPRLKKVLLYGGTPEIRDILNDFNLSTTIVDKSEKMVRAMGLLTNHGKYLGRNEEYTCADWCNLPFGGEEFDFLIGDDAINMVSWTNFEAFLKNAYHVLKEGGYFICHLLVAPSDQYKNKSYEQIISEFKEGKIKTIYDLASQLTYIFTNPNTYETGWQSTLENLSDAQRVELKQYLDFENLFKRCNSKFACPPQNQFENLVKNYFEVLEIKYPHEYDYCQFEPIYFLKKLGE